MDKKLVGDVEMFMDKVKQGLDFIHTRGYAHGDVNPRNIMVDEMGNPKIIDFDSCQKIGDKKSMKCGTEGWDDDSEDMVNIEDDLRAVEKISKYLNDMQLGLQNLVKWEVLIGKTTNILGFTSCGASIRIPDFRVYAFQESGVEGKLKFLRGNKPARVKRVSDVCPDKLSSRLKKSKSYELDIGVLIKFLSDRQLDHVGWVSVKGASEVSKAIKLTTCDREFIVSVQNISNANHLIHIIPDVMVLSFDIECYTFNKGMSDARDPKDVIFMISMIFFKGDFRKDYVLALRPTNFVMQEQRFKHYKLELFDDEFDLLAEFFNLIVKENPDVLIGYNIMGFDMKYILQKYYSLLRNVPEAGRMAKKGYLADEIIYKSWNSAAYGVRESVIFNMVGRCCFDIYNYLTMEVTMQKYSLDYVSQELLGRNKVDMSYAEMFRKYEEGKVVEIADYCFVDSDLTLELWKKLGLWIAAVEQCKLYKVHVHEMYSSGQQKRIFNQLYFFAHHRNYVLDKEEDFQQVFSYQGATVLEPQPGIYRNCAVVDFASLYPSIIIAGNICYTTLVSQPDDEGGGLTFTQEFKGVVPSILESLINSRREVKRLMKEEKDPVMRTIYDKRQFAYKVCANSFYGAFGSRDSRYLQMVSGAKAVTQNGRTFLLNAVEIINEHRLGCKVVYGDTDSCFFSGTDHNLSLEEVFSIVDDINKSFPPPVHVEFEKSIDIMLLLAKKKYIYVCNGKQTSKGVITARRDTSIWTRETYKEVINLVMNGATNKQVNIYLYNQLLGIYSGQVALDRLYINRNLGTNYKSKSYPLNIYKNILRDAEKRDVAAGERLEFYYVKSDSRLQGYHYASKKMIATMNLQVDYDYYVMHQLKGPLIQIYHTLRWCLV
ncbi:hypothetical protein GGF37_000830 [Kickxella alabastrina]|nr:hypothetical protein GGF37_000830 [Kickxella alabastrina]